MFIIFVYYKLK